MSGTKWVAIVPFIVLVSYCLWHPLAWKSHWLRQLIWSKVKNDIFEPLSATFEALNKWNKMSDYCSLFTLGLIQLMTLFSFEKSLTEVIYMVKSQKMTFLSHFQPLFEALNDWNKMSDYCSLLILCLIQLMTSFCLEKALTESIYIVMTFLSHF